MSNVREPPRIILYVFGDINPRQKVEVQHVDTLVEVPQNVQPHALVQGNTRVMQFAQQNTIRFHSICLVDVDVPSQVVQKIAANTRVGVFCRDYKQYYDLAVHIRDTDFDRIWLEMLIDNSLKYERVVFEPEKLPKAVKSRRKAS